MFYKQNIQIFRGIDSLIIFSTDNIQNL